jgi:hypothetical protein
MVQDEYNQQVIDFTKVLQNVTSNIASIAVFETFSPTDLWSKSEASINSLRNLAEKLKKNMLILKPEKALTIEQLHKSSILPLKAFRDTLFQEKNDLTSSRFAFEHLRKAIMSCSEFLSLAKTIQENPSPVIKGILDLKEMSGAKEYLATIPIPEALHTKLNYLIRYIDALNISLSNLEKELNTVKKYLTEIQEKSQNFRSTAVKTVEMMKKPTEDNEK